MASQRDDSGMTSPFFNREICISVYRGSVLKLLGILCLENKRCFQESFPSITAVSQMNQVNIKDIFH